MANPSSTKTSTRLRLEEEEAKSSPDRNEYEGGTSAEQESGEMNPSLPPAGGLFLDPLTAMPMVFGMSSGRDLEEVRRHIINGGGVVENVDQVDATGNRITISDPRALIRPPGQDIFSYQYIRDCLRDNMLRENLAEYRINKSVYEYYDPLDILLGHKKWQDLSKRTPLYQDDAEGEECSDIGKDIHMVQPDQLTVMQKF